MGKAMREFSLECIGLRMAEVSVTQYVIAQPGETITSSIFVRNITVSIIYWIADAGRLVCIGVYGVSAKRHIIWLKPVQILASNQPVHRRSQVGEPDGASPSDFALISDVVLMKAWLLQTERDHVNGWRTK